MTPTSRPGHHQTVHRCTLAEEDKSARGAMPFSDSGTATIHTRCNNGSHDGSDGSDDSEEGVTVEDAESDEATQRDADVLLADDGLPLNGDVLLEDCIGRLRGGDGRFGDGDDAARTVRALAWPIRMVAVVMTT